jgi:hypothetical protein
MDKQLLEKAVPKDYIQKGGSSREPLVPSQKGGSSREPWVPSQLEGFDGIRKNNARQIFGILLIIIVVDFAMELIV